MKSVALVTLLLASVSAFSGSTSFTGSSLAVSASNGSNKLSTMEYIPSGMSKEQWKKMKADETAKRNGKNLGKVGITTFKSRTFTDWQKSGGKNLFPVNPKEVTDPKDLPYMQRPGGSPDNADLSKKNMFSGMFGKKKKEAAPEPEKAKNWWTL